MNEKGVVHILTILLLLAGLAVTVYLATHQQLLRSKADYSQDISQAVSVNGTPCKNGTCEVNTSNASITIDIDGLNNQDLQCQGKQC